MFELKGKTALITGASGGIGAAIAEALHAQGAAVGLSGTRQPVLAALAEKLGLAPGAPAVHVLPANLSVAADADALVGRAEQAMGQVDILINNAGITRDGLAMRMKDEDWQAVIDVDLGAAFRLSRAALRGMMKRRFGRIVSITSVVGTTGNPGQVNYCAAKAGLVGMAKSLAQEVASRGITVNCVAPGFIATAMAEKLDEKQRDAIAGRIPLGRMGSPAEIAAAVVYLCSTEAAYVTGQTLHVNGGMAMI
jgi:3-oxoacyl-[acyl-carrier protein] reductase